MPRTKVKIAFITNDAARRAAYRKRKKGILKKMEELSTLCGIEACAIAYSPYDPKPVIWPSESGVHHVLEKFRTMSEWEKSKKMANQESFLGHMIAKHKEQLKKLVKENKEKEMTVFMHQCLDEGRVLPDNNMTADDLNDLLLIVEQNLKDVSRRLETLNVTEKTPRHQLPPQIQSSPVLDKSANHNQRQRKFMDLLNGNEDETTTVPPFGSDANLQLRIGFWPNLLP